MDSAHDAFLHFLDSRKNSSTALSMAVSDASSITPPATSIVPRTIAPAVPAVATVATTVTAMAPTMMPVSTF